MFRIKENQYDTVYSRLNKFSRKSNYNLITCKLVTAENRAIKWRQRIPKKYFFEKVKPMIITVMRCGFLRCRILCFIFFSLRMLFLKDFFSQSLRKKDNWGNFLDICPFSKTWKMKLRGRLILIFFLNERY